MPELPEVETVVRALQPLVGRRLGTPRVLRADVIHTDGANFNSFARTKRIVAIRRQAKRIIFELGEDRQIQFHLGMTGQLNVKKRSEALLPHTHLLIRLVGTDQELRFRDVRRFGGVWLLNGDASHGGRGCGKLGPDPLTLALAEFRQILSRNRQIKALLLDQTAIGGLGNIYVDESLFKASIHPLTRASVLSEVQVRLLHHAMRRTLRAAIRAGGSTIRDYRSADGEEGWFQLQHQAYGRAGQPCRRCKTPIRRIQAAGRSSHICPTCQRRTKTERMLEPNSLSRIGK